jgi:integrase
VVHTVAEGNHLLLSAGTVIPYTRHVDRFIVPGLGGAKLSSLRVSHVRSFYVWLLAERKVDGVVQLPMSAGMVKKIATTLNVLLNAAVRAELIPTNPARGGKTPKATKRSIQVLTLDQARQLVAACKGEPLGALYALLVDAGLRPSEATALTWADLDFGSDRVSVTKAVDTFAGAKGVKEPKTKGSRRSVPIGPQTLALLNDHRASALRRGRDVTPTGLVFPNAAGGYFDIPGLHSLHYRPFLRRAGLPLVSLYALRHTAATLLMAAGVNPKVVAERLGHSGIGLTLATYSHVSAGMQDQATATLAGLLGGSAASTK